MHIEILLISAPFLVLAVWAIVAAVADWRDAHPPQDPRKTDIQFWHGIAEIGSPLEQAVAAQMLQALGAKGELGR